VSEPFEPFENLRVQREAGIALITIDRPEKRNAIDLATIREMYRVLEATAHDAAVRVLILTGAGDSVFVSGADIGDLRARRRPEALRGLNNRLFTAVEEHPKPVIAALNGAAVGGGLELAIACDLRVAVRGARLGFPETGLGIMPAAGGTQRLPRLIGLAKAKELVLTGDLITAEEAERIGLVSRVVEPPELMETALAIARRIIKKAPLAVAFAKASLNRASEMPMKTGLEYEGIAQAILFESRDKEEGMTAFLEKRKPEFEGR
jgi:enoyl-CoA hydratase